MVNNNSTKSTKSQAPQGSRLALIWLMVSALILGIPVVTLMYFPLKGLSIFLGRPRVIENIADKLFTNLIRLYLWFQPWCRPSVDISTWLPFQQGHHRTLLICNHRSHLDVFIFLSQILRLRVLAKSSLFKIPFLGIMMLATKQISAKKGSLPSLQKAMELVKEAILQGDNVLIFPEFSRCEAGTRGIQQFSLLPFQAALETQCTIIPWVIQNTDALWPRGRWALYTKNKISLRALSPIDSRQYQTATEIRDAAAEAISGVLLKSWN